MFNLGWLEVGLIILLAIVIFGPKNIPALGGALGKGLRGFKEEMGSKQSPEEPQDLDSQD